ncbi:hypothetical protein JKI95_11530 [Corynebacterium aquatimens]|uniref:hypothetical protein n=1 Tax=Corynebacterium TaxID=1716 RepID=UPI001F23EF53|nr:MULTISPECIES: hypothetical protein [Corynebacterium]QYH19613.1 hypothetical protein JKI95_11530 [Corynebacterium aquatimens]UIZ91408.1 hypothetical protein JZY91_06450 [Corynebacterium sp. CNCTC7651]
MKSSDRDLSRALAGALVLAAVVMLVVLLRLPGLILSLILIAFVVLVGRRYQPSAEVEALHASLSYARDDICEVLDAYEQLQNGASAADIADRTLHYPALANPDNSVPEVNEFLLRASSARRFVARIDSYLEDPLLDRSKLEKLINVADQRAFELQSAWDDARRAAKEIGPA